MFNLKPKSQPRRSSHLKVVSSSREPFGKRQSSSIGSTIFLLLICGALAYGYYTLTSNGDSPTVINEDGEEVLSPERKAKLDRELDEFDNSVQYALIAIIDGYYPCYTCPNGSPTIFLYENQIWKYGSSRKGEKGRYPNGNYGAPNLRFVEQFWGTEMECRKQEKFMIYNYPLLPEAKKRGIRLFRPPGNKNDN